MQFPSHHWKQISVNWNNMLHCVHVQWDATWHPWQSQTHIILSKSQHNMSQQVSVQRYRTGGQEWSMCLFSQPRRSSSIFIHSQEQSVPPRNCHVNLVIIFPSHMGTAWWSSNLTTWIKCGISSTYFIIMLLDVMRCHSP